MGDGKEPRREYGREFGKHGQDLEHGRELLEADHVREVQSWIRQPEEAALVQDEGDGRDERDDGEGAEGEKERGEWVRRARRAATRK